VGTKVIAAESLPQTVFVYDGAAGCPLMTHFGQSHIAVIDGVEWPGMATVRAGLIRKRRAFKAPFHPEMPAAVMEDYEVMVQAIRDFALPLLTERHEDDRSSFRPMITGPEPMHFDSYEAPRAVLQCFVNVAATPRIYRVGPTFQRLVETQPDAMRKVATTCGPHGLSYSIRRNTVAGLPPLPSDGDSHTVEFAPGAIWIFNGKTASHEVVYGEGAVAVAWVLPDSTMPTQESLMETLQ
jgi:hypothetical protein